MIQHPNPPASLRRTSRWTGALFLLPLLAYGAGNAWMEALRATPQALTDLPFQRLPLLLAGLLLLLNSVAVVLIAVQVYPVLASLRPRVALAYLCVRMAEALLLAGGLLALLLLPELVAAEQAGAGHSLVGLALRTNFLAFQLAMLVLGVGSLAFCRLLGRAGLVPAALAWWGLLGYALLAVGAVLELLGLPYGVLLSLPGGLFEVALAVWLLAKGFNPATLPAITPA